MVMSRDKRNKNTEGGFVPIRRGIYEHLSDGRMTGKELMIYTTLHLKADHLTGICYKVSGVALGLLLKESTNYINRIMRSLERKGYIKRLSHRGQVKHYPVVLNKYLTSNGILIDARNTKSLNEIAWYIEEDCTLTALQRHINCTSNALQLHTLQYIKNIRVKEVKKSRGEKPHTPKSFTPPTADEVKKYADSVGFPKLDTEYFCEYYTAADWKHKDGSLMQNWKLTVVSWKRREKQSKEQNAEEPTVHTPQTPTVEQLAIIEGKQK